MKIFKAILALSLLSTSAFAQEDNTTKLELAREAITAMQADKMFDSMGVQLKQLVRQQTPIPENATPEQKEKFDELQNKIMDLSLSEAKTMIAKMDVVYAEVYTEAELSAMVAFFNSAEGKSMVAKQPKIMETIMPMLQEMQRNLMPKVKQLVEEAKADLKNPTPAE